MANPEHIAILNKGVDAWNQWREDNPDVKSDLSGANLKKVQFEGADLRATNLNEAHLVDANLVGANLAMVDLEAANLRGANLIQVNLDEANLRDADLEAANLREANLVRVDLFKANLRYADLFKANLFRANLRRARLREADLAHTNLFFANLEHARLRKADLCFANLGHACLRGADLRGADLSKANLLAANLQGAKLMRAILEGVNLVGAELQGVDLRGASVHGASVWDVQLDDATKQTNLVITSSDQPTITCDNLEIAQFLHLMLNNQRLNSILETLTTKVALILGRFTDERKRVLDALREALRRKDYVPIMFDFEKPVDRSIADTVTTLARMARFVIADVTDPSWVTVETRLVVRELPAVPFRLIVHGEDKVHSSIEDLRAEAGERLIAPFRYQDVDHVVASVDEILQPAEELAEKVRRRRREIEENPW